MIQKNKRINPCAGGYGYTPKRATMKQKNSLMSYAIYNNIKAS